MCEELENELAKGKKATIELADHLEHMGGAANCKIPVETKTGNYTVTVVKEGMEPGRSKMYLQECIGRGWLVMHGNPITGKEYACFETSRAAEECIAAFDEYESELLEVCRLGLFAAEQLEKTVSDPTIVQNDIKIIKSALEGKERATEDCEAIQWLEKLISYLKGEIKWDTGGIWVCEQHPFMPYGMGYEFDCNREGPGKCAGPGMPPYDYKKEPAAGKK